MTNNTKSNTPLTDALFNDRLYQEGFINNKTLLDEHNLNLLLNGIRYLRDNKVSVDGSKGLSTNDFTNALKDKLDGIEDGAQVNVTPDTTYTPNSDNAQSGKAVAQAIETTVGRKTAGGGEIFNDYENNQAISHYSSARGSNNLAGSKAFYITALDETNLTFTLDGDVSELAIDDVYSCQLTNAYEAIGKITAIDINTNTVTVDTFPTGYTWKAESIFRIPKKPLAGSHIIGECAYTEGSSNISSQANSHSEGYQNIASGKYSHAEGRKTYAGYAAHSEGYETQAIANATHAEGQNTVAKGLYSHAEGYRTQALNIGSHAEGSNTIAKGNDSHAEGYKAEAVNSYSHAEGQDTTASGIASHSEGTRSTASGHNTHAEGEGTTASGYNSHAEGKNTVASGTEAHAEGFDTKAEGSYSHAEGKNTKAEGNNSHAENVNTIAEGVNSHAEGLGTLSQGNNSHSEGWGTKAVGVASHTEGMGSEAEGVNAHAEGYYTKANGKNSHAEGQNTLASYENSHASGEFVFTGRKNQTAVGEYNKTVADALFIVGNGISESDKKNAFEVKTDGSAVLQKSAVTDDAVVRYEQIKNILADAKEYTDKEIAEFDFIKINTALPETGLPNRMYLVPSATTTEQDLFDEYIWVNKGTEDAPEYVWEFVASKKVEVDLTDYVKKDELSAAIESAQSTISDLEGYIYSVDERVTESEKKVSECYDTVNGLPIPSDYIVGQGTDGIWSYTKWNSGRITLHYSTRNSGTTADCVTEIGAVYCSDDITFDVPAQCIAFDAPQSTGSIASMYSGVFTWTLDTKIYCKFWSLTPATSTYRLVIDVEGRWK